MRILIDTERQWLFDKEALGHTPSRGAGISLEEELERRKTVISFVESLLFRATQCVERYQPRSLRSWQRSDGDDNHGFEKCLVHCGSVDSSLLHAPVFD